MKKSKVIVPAMALLVFSTAASITGAYAWFTSNRTFNTSAGEFEIINNEGNMAYSITGGAAVTVYDKDDHAYGSGSYAAGSDKVVVNTGAQFINASYDPVGHKFYRYTPNATNIFEQRSDSQLEMATNIYSWTPTFLVLPRRTPTPPLRSLVSAWRSRLLRMS